MFLGKKIQGRKFIKMRKYSSHQGLKKSRSPGWNWVLSTNIVAKVLALKPIAEILMLELGFRKNWGFA